MGGLKTEMNGRDEENAERGKEEEGFEHRGRRAHRDHRKEKIKDSLCALCALCGLCSRTSFPSLRLCGSIVFILLTACGGGATPTPTVLRAQQTALAQLTAVPGTPAATLPRSASPVVSPSAQGAVTVASPTAGGANAVTPIPVTETPGLQPLPGGTTYTNPAKTYQIDLPPGWTPPAPDPTTPGRVMTRAPKDAVTVTIEEGPAPDNWARLMPPVVAGLLDAEYRKGAPGATLQTTLLTGIRGVSDSGLPTYDFTYLTRTNGVAETVERFVTLTFAGAITVTATAAPDVASATHPAIEGIVGSLVPLKLDVPTPAALAPGGGGGAITRTPSGLGVALPGGWVTVAPPASPPGVEFAAQSANGDQGVRVVRKQVTGNTKLNDFAATLTDELKGTTDTYEVESEGMNTIGSAPAVRSLYRATVRGKAVVGQSVTLIKGSNGYAIRVEVPAAQYDAKPDDAQALFDRVESSIILP